MWTLEKIWNWYQKQPWIVGFNYLPSNAVNSTEMWQKETFSSVSSGRRGNCRQSWGGSSLFAWAMRRMT